MKLLLLSDLHSNPWALEAILRIESQYDLLCFSGDLVDYGTAPISVMNRIFSLPNTKLVYGNHDRNAIRVYREGSFRNVPKKSGLWVHQNLAQMSEQDIDQLDSLPQFQTFLADGWAYLMCHQYIPGTYQTIESRTQFEEFWCAHTPDSFHAYPQRRILVGHTHRQCIHTLGRGMEWINPGSASYRRPDDPDKTAHYITIRDGIVEMHGVSYDRTPLHQETLRQLKLGQLSDAELKVAFFFFGNAKTVNDPLPFLPESI